MKRLRGAASRALAASVLATAIGLAGCALVDRLAPGGPEREWQRVTSELRELAFLDPVELRWIARVELPELVREELRSSFGADEVERYRDAYASLGLVPPELDLVEALVGMLSDQLAGLYSPIRRQMYVVRDLTEEDPGQVPMILVHEHVHALQHQHFPDVVEIMQALRTNDDVVLAMGATVEGDASLTMLASPAAGEYERDLASALAFQERLLYDLENPTGVTATLPRLLQASQIFAYAYGTPAAAEAFVEAGNAGLDARLRNPALSTLRVRFPEETHPIEFLRLPLDGLLAAVEADGCQLGHHNVAGLVTLEIFLQEYAPDVDPEPLLRRWSGDRFLHLYCPQAWELIWLVRWRDPAAAQEFARLYRAAATRVASASPLSGPPRVVEAGRSVVILSPGVFEHASLIVSGSEIRGYQTFREWRADDCFPESPCPGIEAQAGSSRHSKK